MTFKISIALNWFKQKLEAFDISLEYYILIILHEYVNTITYPCRFQLQRHLSIHIIK